MNLDDKTRKAQVLQYLVDHAGDWVDGPEIANEKVGGSEGLRRIRELREEGHAIKQRRHPDPARAIWQYQLPPTVRLDPIVKIPKARPPDPPAEAPRFTSIPSKVTFGSVIFCDRCKGKTTEPGFRSRTCKRCNGLGVIPNTGVIP